MNFYVFFVNSYGYNHKNFIKIYGSIMNQKLILWEFVVKLYFNLEVGSTSEYVSTLLWYIVVWFMDCFDLIMNDYDHCYELV